MDHKNEQGSHDPETEQDTASGGPADPPETDDDFVAPPENPSGG